MQTHSTEPHPTNTTTKSTISKVCIVGASGKLGQYMIKHCLDRGYAINGVCREQSVPKLDNYKDQITMFPGPTNDRDVIKCAVEGCDGVLVVLAPWGFINYSSGTAQAVLDFAEPGARLIFSCGWHISKDGLDKYTWGFRAMVRTFSFIGWATRLADLDDQVEACRRIFNSDSKWTVVRGSDLQEGESEGLPVWSKHIGDPVLKSNLTRRIDFALFMVAAMEDEKLVKEAPAIVGCKTPSAVKYGSGISLA
ncbi:hypothetical protein Ndes2526B_g00675 [Nannochloris sp. 'desiccata']|nr:putative Cinnamoyl-CoA reductase 1 [Chlorella desiccata (nom. nud.)]